MEKYFLMPNGIFHLNGIPIAHRECEYPEEGFASLFQMQNTHFWYLGRQKFILNSVQKHVFTPLETHQIGELEIIDMGGGAGGWIRHLTSQLPIKPRRIALADSSLEALKYGKKIIPNFVERYQIDLLRLEWEKEWDAVFMLDVIEHIPEDSKVLSEVFKALKPGGKLFITVPALNFFWSANDDAAKHIRRYSKESLIKIAVDNGFIVKDVRYFMFFLSPLYWLSRRQLKNVKKEKLIQTIRSEHENLNFFLNFFLKIIFCLETPLGHHIKFPWGTSLLAVIEKPA